MITPEEMTAELWVDLLRIAGVTDIDQVKIAWVQGPVIAPDAEGEFVVYAPPEFFDSWRSASREIETAFNG